MKSAPLTLLAHFGLMLLAAAHLATLPLVSANPADFTVESPVDGKVFKLSEAKGKFVALHFLLKTECPFCLRHTHEYASKSAGQDQVRHVFLKPDSADEIKSWAPKTTQEGVVPTIYRDPDATLAGQFGIPGGYQFHGQTVHYPALVVLDKSGKEVFRYVGKSNSDRYSYAQFMDKLAELNGAAPASVQQYNLGPDKLAISGYDPVAYFTVKAAVKGRKELTVTHRGVTYQFASESNRKLFTESPDKYVPTYGGWCATAMAKGDKVEIDPANFKVTNGRLFLFFKAFYANAINDWNKNEPALTEKADANWKKIAGE